MDRVQKLLIKLHFFQLFFGVFKVSKIGIALFVDAKKPADGYACEQGKSTEISGLHELSTDVLWVTNIRPYDFIQGGYGQLRHLRSSNFFRTDLGYLIREWSLEGDLSEASEYLFRVLNRSLHVIQDRNSIDPQDSRTGLRQSLSEIVVPDSINEPLIDNIEINNAVAQSIQYNQGRASSTRIPAGTKIHSFVVPRSALASYLMSRCFPSSRSWQPITIRSGVLRIGSANGRSANDPASDESFAKMLEMAPTKQFYLDIDVREIDRRFANHKSFGVGDRTSRQYACVEEVAEMSSYSIIDIRGGWSCDRNKEPLPYPDMPDEFSVGRSIANEIYSLAVASNKDSNKPSPWTAYLRCLERIVLGRAADQFNRHGFVVGSYGTGRVNVFLRSAEKQKAAELALSLGLLPPFSLLTQPLSPSHVAFKPKLYYRDDIVDGLIGLTDFIDCLESDWLRMFVAGAALKGENPSGVQLELDALLDLPEDRRLASFEALVIKHIQDVPETVSPDTEDSDESDDGLTF